MRRACLRCLFIVFAAALVGGIFTQSSFGITWCFDWVAYEVNGHIDTNRNSAASLEVLLRTKGYRQVLEVKATTSSGTPRAQDIGLAITPVGPPAPGRDEKLKPGDVLIFGTSHTGIVRSSNGSFDHFLQIPGKTGTAYTPQEATHLQNYFVGPGRRWTLQQLFALSRDKPPEYTDEWNPLTWAESIRRWFGAPKQYPFLHTTAVVWRASTQWDVTGTWQTLQSNSYHVTWTFSQTGTTVSGTAMLSNAEAEAQQFTGPVGKVVKGSLVGDRLDVVVQWPAKTDGTVASGEYVGTVVAGAQPGQGEVKDGEAWNVANPSLKATWTGSGDGACTGGCG